MGGLLATIAGILFYFATDHGTLRISSDDKNATVLVKKGSKTIKELIVENGKGEIRLRTGDYDLLVKGDAKIAIEPKQVSIQRGVQESAEVTSVQSGRIADDREPHSPIATKNRSANLKARNAKIARLGREVIVKRRELRRVRDTRAGFNSHIRGIDEAAMVVERLTAQTEKMEKELKGFGEQAGLEEAAKADVDPKPNVLREQQLKLSQLNSVQRQLTEAMSILDRDLDALGLKLSLIHI